MSKEPGAIQQAKIPPLPWTTLSPPFSDVDQKGMRRLLRDFAEALDDAGPDSVGLFYFSGHGVQVRGENFLVPTDAAIGRESDVRIEAVSANEVLNTPVIR